MRKKEPYQLGGKMHNEAALAMNLLGEMFGNVASDDPAWSEALATLESVIEKIKTAPRPPRRFRIPHQKLLTYGEALSGVVEATRAFLETPTEENGEALIQALRDAGRRQSRL